MGVDDSLRDEPVRGCAVSANRTTFLLRVGLDRLGDYLRAHEVVWPEMRAALHRSGWGDYSLAVDHDTGLVVGSLRTADFPAAQSRMGSEAVNARWQRAMAEYMAPLEPGCAPGTIKVLDTYFTNA